MPVQRFYTKRQTTACCQAKCCFLNILHALFFVSFVKLIMEPPHPPPTPKNNYPRTRLVVTWMLGCVIPLPQKALAVAEQQALLSRLSQTQEACDHLKEQLEALRRNSLSLQDSCTSLQTLNTQLQVTEYSAASFLSAANEKIIRSPR